MSGFHTSSVLKLYHRNNLWSVRFVTSRSCIFHILVLQIIGKPSLRARCPQSGGRREVIATTSTSLPGTLCICCEPRSSWSCRGHGIRGNLCICWVRPFWWLWSIYIVYLNHFQELRLILNSKNVFCFPDTRGLEKKFNCPYLTQTLSVTDGNFLRQWK